MRRPKMSISQLTSNWALSLLKVPLLVSGMEPKPGSEMTGADPRVLVVCRVIEAWMFPCGL